jgi:hypothetical protein
VEQGLEFPEELGKEALFSLVESSGHFVKEEVLVTEQVG